MDDQHSAAFRRSLGVALQRKRMERGWSRFELVANSGISAATIVAIEHGTRSPKLETLVDLCSVLAPHGIAVEDLVADILRDSLAAAC